ncbi:hypothetical protein MCEMSEM18_03522 [Comamonadaceae bacterium]
MNPVTKLTIAAQSDDEFDAVLARTNDLCGLAIDLKTGNSFYKALVVREVRADPMEKVISIDFDTNALNIFGVKLDGLAALAAAENATRH